MSDLCKVKINDQIIEIPGSATLMQACEQAELEIPRFCYHDRLSIAGNCRMCLVEIVGSSKPVASCAMNVRDLRPPRNGEFPEIKTRSPLVKKAREGVMEFLLINHPLDCPICDQGGECDLQDQASLYGRGSSRYHEEKRAVENKDMGPLIKTVMTRCIQCTRCVRFATEIAGVETLGMIGRGEHTEITPYLEQSIDSVLSGNLIDLCPVGALTSKPYAFHGRSWELRKTESIDVMDAMGANIRIDSRGKQIMRILPRINDEINEEWISDKTRFSCDGLSKNRIDHPYIRLNGRLKKASWDEALARLANRLKRSPNTMAALSGDLACIESMQVLKDILTALGVKSMDCRQEGAQIDLENPHSWFFNSGIIGIDQADSILMLGTNPSLESPVLNARIRRNWLNRELKIGVLGKKIELGYEYDHLGETGKDFERLIQTKSNFMTQFKQAEFPMLILGMGALAREDGAEILNLAYALSEKFDLIKPEKDWNGFNLLHTAAARAGGLALGFYPKEDGLDTTSIIKRVTSNEIQTLFLLGADEIDRSVLQKAFVIYLGTHGDKGAEFADIVLPGASYTEKDALWMNIEGRVQMGWRSVYPPGEAKEDWRILRALADQLNIKLPYQNLFELRSRIAREHSFFTEFGKRVKLTKKLTPKPFDQKVKLSDQVFSSLIEDFYITDPISRSSKTMRACSEYAAEKNRIYTPRKRARV